MLRPAYTAASPGGFPEFQEVFKLACDVPSIPGMNATEILHRIGDSLSTTATARAVFGEPIQLNGKTVVPVAKIAYGFGAGSGGAGRRKRTEEDISTEPNPQHAEGGGGGGGIRACPAGALEITATQTRFIPFHDIRLVAAAFAAGVVWGGLVWRKMKRS